MLYKLVLVIAIASCLLMPVIAFARGGHGGGGRAHGGNYKSNYNIGYPGVGSCWRRTIRGYVWICRQ
jgi:hypothetical protein